MLKIIINWKLFHYYYKTYGCMNVLTKHWWRKWWYDKITIWTNVTKTVNIGNGGSIGQRPPYSYRWNAGHLTRDHGSRIVKKVHFGRWFQQKTWTTSIWSYGGRLQIGRWRRWWGWWDHNISRWGWWWWLCFTADCIIWWWVCCKLNKE